MKLSKKEKPIKIMKGSDVSDNMTSRSKAVFNFLRKQKYKKELPGNVR
ncbi:hypothetical protein HYX06_04370 [Candidatus Woesearchaeota archaeon]|nr:hypothetical protein [Candidatus Woesearchaeota archaeon]